MGYVDKELAMRRLLAAMMGPKSSEICMLLITYQFFQAAQGFSSWSDFIYAVGQSSPFETLKNHQN